MQDFCHYFLPAITSIRDFSVCSWSCRLWVGTVSFRSMRKITQAMLSLWSLPGKQQGIQQKSKIWDGLFCPNLCGRSGETLLHRFTWLRRVLRSREIFMAVFGVIWGSRFGASLTPLFGLSWSVHVQNFFKWTRGLVYSPSLSGLGAPQCHIQLSVLNEGEVWYDGNHTFHTCKTL